MSFKGRNCHSTYCHPEQREGSLLGTVLDA